MAGTSSAEDPIRDVEDSSSDEELSSKNGDDSSKNGKEAVSELLETPAEEASTNKRRKFSSNASLETLLEELLKNTVSPEYEDVEKDRDTIWLDVMQFYKKKVNDISISSLKKSLEVSFKNEEGLDAGARKIKVF
eukprot:gene10277-18974_t